jgi:tetratricopeptide (TPR) repeat protein
MGLGRPQEAVEEMERGRGAGVLSGFDYFVLGQGYLQLGQWDQARAGYESAVKHQPDCTSAYYGLFTVYTRLNERDKAQAYKATFERLKAEEMKVLKDRNDAFSDLQEMRLSLATTYVVAGIQYEDCQDTAKAEQMLRRAAELDPQNVNALNELGTLCRGSGRTAEALELYRKAAAVEPPHPACWLNLGILLAQSNRFAEAEEALRKVIQLLPDQSDGYREMAQLYLRAQVKLPEARALAERAVALQPVAQNYFVLSRACDQNGDPPRALAALRRAMELAPANRMYRQTYDRLRAREARP